MRRIAWGTDVHLDFVDAKGLREFADIVAAQRPTALLLTGDIAGASSIKKILPDLRTMLAMPIYYVIGNHDCYGGSITAVRKWAKEPRDGVHWMGSLDPINVGGVGLIGVDGWGDGKLGAPLTSQILLNDWDHIQEFRRVKAMHLRSARMELLQKLGREEATKAEKLLDVALAKFKHVIFMTHVPPWREATWHEGEPSGDDWLPWFSCAAVGEAIEDAAMRHPGRKITVLCGHVHGKGYSVINDQIDAYTGGAEYGAPTIQGILEIGNGAISFIPYVEPLT